MIPRRMNPSRPGQVLFLGVEKNMGRIVDEIASAISSSYSNAFAVTPSILVVHGHSKKVSYHSYSDGSINSPVERGAFEGIYTTQVPNSRSVPVYAVSQFVQSKIHDFDVIVLAYPQSKLESYWMMDNVNGFPNAVYCLTRKRGKRVPDVPSSLLGKRVDLRLVRVTDYPSDIAKAESSAYWSADIVTANLFKSSKPLFVVENVRVPNDGSFMAREHRFRAELYEHLADTFVSGAEKQTTPRLSSRLPYLVETDDPDDFFAENPIEKADNESLIEVFDPVFPPSGDTSPRLIEVFDPILEQHPVAPQEGGMLNEQVILHRVETLASNWVAYELDPILLLEYPLMSDACCEETSEFLHAYSNLNATLTAYQSNKTVSHLSLLRAELERAEKAFIKAENKAKKVRGSYLTAEQRKRLSTARQLALLALDEGASPNERISAWKKANDYLEGIMLLPDTPIRGLLTAV